MQSILFKGKFNSIQAWQLHTLATLPPRKEHNAKHPVQRKIQFSTSMTASHPGHFTPKETAQCKASSSKKNSILYMHECLTPSMGLCLSLRLASPSPHICSTDGPACNTITCDHTRKTKRPHKAWKLTKNIRYFTTTGNMSDSVHRLENQVPVNVKLDFPKFKCKQNKFKFVMVEFHILK
jgi:hypothetical protein